MLNFIHALHILKLGVLDNDPRTKRFVDGDLDVTVDRGGNYKASMLPVIGGKIGTAAAETDSQRTSSNDHRADLAAHSTVSATATAQPLNGGPEAASGKRPHSARCAFRTVILE